MRPKYRQNAALNPLPLIGPGFRGLNTELADTIGQIDPTWALALQNTVFDSKGRVALRKGYTAVTTSAMTGTPTVRKVYEWVRDDGTTQLAAATDSKLWISTDAGVSWSDITGSLSFSAGHVVFTALDDILYATTSGQKVWKYTGSGTFTEISTSPVTRGVLISAYGRLWAAQDGSSSIYYCALLDGSTWSGTGTGSIDLAKVWTLGADNIVSLAAFGAAFVVFGRRHIVIYVDGEGSELGIQPDKMYVTDTIEGTGAVARDAVVSIGEGDLWFLSPLGIQSLTRVIAEKNNPIVSISRNVRSLVTSLISAHTGSADDLIAAFSAANQFALFVFPASSRVLCVDTRLQMEDGTYRFSEWRSLPYKGVCVSTADQGRTIWFPLAGGKIAKYDGYRDDTTGGNTSYSMVYSSPWIDGGPEAHNRLKILKELSLRLYGRETITGTLRWAIDYRPLEYSQAFTSDYTASGAEWGTGEWGEDEFGTGLRMRYDRIAMGQEGQYVQVYLTLASTDVAEVISLQELDLYMKLGTYV